MCSKGDDPLTLNQKYFEFSMQVTSTALALSGYVGLEFMGVTSFLAVGASASNSSCSTSLQASGRFQNVRCSYSMLSSYVDKFTIRVLAWPQQPGLNNLYSHNGNPSITDFFCDISQTNSDSQCLFTAIVNTNLVGP